MKKAKKTLSILLAVLMIALSITFVGAASNPKEITVSGTCGDNITWTFENGTLTVNGTGAIKPLTREEVQAYIEYEYNEDTMRTEPVEKTRIVTLDYYPWGLSEELGRVVAASYGLDADIANKIRDENASLDVLVNLKESDMDPLAAFLSCEMNLIDTIVIGNGITSIPSGAFEFLPKRISLPESIRTVEPGAFNYSFLKELIALNPNANFQTITVDIDASANGELPITSVEELVEIGVDAQIVESIGYFLITPIMLDVENLDRLFYDLTFWPTTNGFQNDEAKLDNYLTQIEKNYRKELEAYHVETINDLVSTIIQRVNSKIKTSFTNLNDFYEIVNVAYDEDPQASYPTWEETEAFKSAYTVSLNQMINEYNERYAAFIERYEEYSEKVQKVEFGSYLLGNTPVISVTKRNEQTGESYTYELNATPNPWITVYGYANSTLQAAAAISGVNFVSLESVISTCSQEFISAVNGLAELNDSNACKALIAAAKNAIAAFAYDSSKTLEENIATLQATGRAIVANLRTDLDAQRAAEAQGNPKPTEPETTEPTTEPADGSSNEKPAEKLNFFQRIIQWFKSLFAKLFGRKG